MTATQAPTPGPLTSESVKLLVKGDLLRIDTGGALYRFLRTKASPSSLVIAEPIGGGLEGYYDRCRFAFIGRPDADGWMPWSGGENPVPGQKVEIRWRTDRSEPGAQIFLSDELGWRDPTIIAFRLAPTAPVEASGSERGEDALEALNWIENVFPGQGDTNDQGVTVRGWQRLDQACATIRTALFRPQPSGETRELVARTMLRDAFIAGRVVSTATTGSQDQRDAEAYAAERDLSSLSTTPARAEAQDEGALSVLDRLLNYSGARGSFDAMKHGDAVKDAEELLRSARSPGHTDLMVTPESIDAYMRVNPMEAQDEGAAGELKPCPFCGGEAEIIHLDDGDNAGGSCVCCTKCQASGNVEFGRKENFVDNWNRRAHPSPTPAADADRVRGEQIQWRQTPPPQDGTIIYGHSWSPYRWKPYSPKSEQARGGIKGRWQAMNGYGGWENAFPPNEWASEEQIKARQALAALKSTAAKEGGAL